MYTRDPRLLVPVALQRGGFELWMLCSMNQEGTSFEDKAEAAVAAAKECRETRQIMSGELFV